MLLNPSVQMAFSLTNITGFTSCTSKIINGIGLKRFRYGVLTTEKLLSFNDENAILISMPLQKRL